MPVYDSTSFPTDAIFANGSITGGPTFQTQVVHTANGYEQRNGRAGIHARRIFHLDTATIDNATRGDVLLFYDARRGQSDSFRFKDPFDHTAVNEPIVGSQLVKRYTAGSVSYDRPIVKPINGTVSFSGGGTLNYETGVISGSAGGTWSGQFEIQARFSVDRYTEVNYFANWHELNVDIVEVFDYDIPGSAGVTLSPTIAYEFPLPLEVGRERHHDFSTYLVQGGGHSEDRFAQYANGVVGFAGNVLCANRDDLEILLSAFLCVRGRRTAFQREGFDVRFDRDALVIGYTGNESFECPIGFVGLAVNPGLDELAALEQPPESRHSTDRLFT
jgi:uncharacterized protein (TIGR02217 family)